MCLGIPARIVEAIDVSGQRVLVDLQGKQQQVSAAMLMSEATDLPGPGDWVVVHLGFALSRMDEAEAQSVLAGPAGELRADVFAPAPTAGR